MNLLEVHREAGYFIKVEEIPEINGIKLTYPDKNIDHNDLAKKSWKIYESDIDTFNIYRDGKKMRGFPCAIFAHRILLMADYHATCNKFDIDSKLFLLYKGEEPIETNISRPSELIKRELSKKERDFARIFANMLLDNEYQSLTTKFKLKKETKYLEEIFEIGGY